MAVLVGQPHQRDPSAAGLHVLLGEPGQAELVDEDGDAVDDGLRRVVQAGALSQVGGIVPRVAGGVPGGHGDAVHAVGAERVDRQRRAHRGVDPAGEPHQDGAEPVLLHVVPQARHQRAPHLGGLREGRRGGGGGRRRVRGERVVADHPANDLEALPVRPPSGVAGQVEVHHQQVLLEAGGPGEHGAVPTAHQGVTVEDQFVLTAHEVDVGHRDAGPARVARDQVPPRVPLGAFVGRAVDADNQVRALGRQGVGRSGALPDVLADHDAEVDPVEAHHRQSAAWEEVPELVEHAVVGQVVLRVAGHDLTTVQ